ncbi:MAG: tRNA epoxyqueuosine(34) reductase QueG [Nitrospira sp.]|nr:tRNA epoxyqueuosine(34) reductase QueG [Nitrospira sp.]
MSLTESIKREARVLGFDAVGIARVAERDQLSAVSGQPAPGPTPVPTQVSPLLYDRLTEWLRRGYQGTMAWMGRTPEKRADPQHVLRGCRSVISVGLNYLTDHRADERPGYGRIARYAWGRDYHKVLGERLTQLEQAIQRLAPDAVTRSYTDTGPIMEKAWAEQAGLGWIGKHSNLVSTDQGSWLLLGEILTTLELEPDEPGTDLCGSCTLCIQACPTGAIAEPYVVDATRCISYLTIEWRGEASALSPELQRGIGNKIFGCDDCLDVCPFNLRAEPTQEAAFQPNALTLAPQLDALARLSEADFSREFRQSPIRRAKPEGLRRNVGIAQRNQKSC